MDHTTVIAVRPNCPGGVGGRFRVLRSPRRRALSCADAILRIPKVTQRRAVPIPCWGDTTCGWFVCLAPAMQHDNCGQVLKDE